MTTRLLSAAEAVRVLPDRVRFRCAFSNPVSAKWAMLDTAALALPGVVTARVNARARSLTVEFDPAQTDITNIQNALLAFSGSVEMSGDEADSLAWKALLTSAAVLLGAGLLPKAVQFGVSLVAAMPLLREAQEDITTIGVSSRVLEGIAVAISLSRGDYRVANTTNFLLALGTYLSESTARKSDDLLRDLLRPAHPSAWVLQDGREIEVPVDDISVGDMVVVASGAVVPIDGRVLSGEASVNEAPLTGEVTPVAKSRGDRLMSGSIVQEGRLVVYAETVGAETVTTRIADYVKRSLASKGRTQMNSAQLADQLAPTILSLAAGSFAISGDWRRPASVLQADYSCALKLATPIAFRFAMYRAGQAGVLIKGADALERLGEADTIVFDKTGTLTTGVLDVTDAITFSEEFSPDDLLHLAASVEEHYAFHPLAMAVVEAARATGETRHFDHQEVEFIVAHGVASVIDGKRIVVGSRHFIEDDEEIDVSPHQDYIEELYADGKTVLFIGFGGKLLGLLGLEDTLRPSAGATITGLRRLGAKRIVMLTGDRSDRAALIAKQLGIDEFRAELLPGDKAEIIAEMSQNGARLAFIGDGINDAPALSEAHVGIAMSRGADLARMSADLVLLEDDIAGLLDAVVISQDVMGIIRKSFNLTIGLNTAVLAGAAVGLLSPMTTALLHNGSTIAILLNVLQQRIGRQT